MAILHLNTVGVLLSSLISPIWAAQCGATPTRNASYLYINSPDDLKNQTQNCDLDTTGVYIEPEFVGAFSLNGISNVSSVDLDRYGRQAWNFDFRVTSVDLNETTYMKKLGITRARGLKTVSAPKLEINFPLLRNISWVFSYGPLDISTGDMPPFQADFPSLETAAAIGVFGNISSWKTPKLQSIKRSNPSYYVKNEAKLRIDHNGAPLALDFPVLSEVTTIDLSGNLSSLSFPALQNVTNLRISPNGYTNSRTNSTPMTVNLSALRTVGVMSISGNVTSLSLDSLTNFASLYIANVSPLNCTPIIIIYERIRHAKYNPDKTLRDFHCLDSTEDACLSAKYAPKKKKVLAKGTIAGIIVGVMAFVCFILAMWYATHRSKRDYTIGPRTSGIAGERVVDEHELRQRDSMSIKDPAPPYQEATRT